MKIIIDPGHGGKDTGGGSNSFWKEKDMNLKISLYQYESFKKLGIDVSLTRDKDIYLDFDERTKIVKISGSNICISNHINWYSDKLTSGAEVIYSIHDEPTLSRMILDSLIEEGAKERRIFSKEHPSKKGEDYYYMHQNTGDVETVIIEYGFASNDTDTIKLLEDWKLYAEAVISAICKYIGFDYDDVLNRTKIIGNSQVSLEKMQHWVINRGATDKFISAADNYFKYGTLTGIRADILYCQSAKETNFGHFTGVVKEENNNFAGIKIRNPQSGNLDDFEIFRSIDDGVRGHFNHMAAYVGKYPIGNPHERFFLVKSLPWAGNIRFVKELSEKWATDINYGNSIIKSYLIDLLNTNEEPTNYKKLYEKSLKEKQLIEESLKDLVDKFKDFINNM